MFDKQKNDILSKLDKSKKGVVDKELEGVHKFWKKITQASWIKTPDEAMNFLTNKWYRYQALAARMWARTAYYQCSGGIGFRDQLQDSNCLLESESTSPPAFPNADKV